MFAASRGVVSAALLMIVVGVAACGSDPPATPSGSAKGSANPSASGAVASGSLTPTNVASASPVAATPTTFWQAAARALSRSGRMRVVMSGNGIRELRYEPKASGVIADGALTSVCVSGAAYTVQGIQSTVVPGKWSCGGPALVSSFRKSGQPVYAWNSRLPVDSKIRESVTTPARDHWQWNYTSTSRILGGAVKVTLTLDVPTGRLISGTRTDPTGTTRFTFSYTTIFAPIALP